jgi:DNA-binding NarL/FixJ family response regulator
MLMKLPVSQSTSAHQTRGSCDASPHLRTFIVEDSPIIRENLIATLEETTPVQVVGSAADEGAALRWLEDANHGCDLVIVDVVLQGGSGLGVLRSAELHRIGRRCVVLTNYATPDMRTRCLELGAERVFDKSNELDDLIEYCAHMAGGHGGRA